MNGTMPSSAHSLNANFQSVSLIILTQRRLVDNFHFETATTAPRNLANAFFAYKWFINWHYNGLHSSSPKAFLLMSHVGKRVSFFEFADESNCNRSTEYNNNHQIQFNSWKPQFLALQAVTSMVSQARTQTHELRHTSTSHQTTSHTK